MSTNAPSYAPLISGELNHTIENNDVDKYLPLGLFFVFLAFIILFVVKYKNFSNYLAIFYWIFIVIFAYGIFTTLWSMGIELSADLDTQEGMNKLYVQRQDSRIGFTIVGLMLSLTIVILLNKTDFSKYSFSAYSWFGVYIFSYIAIALFSIFILFFFNERYNKVLETSTSLGVSIVFFIYSLATLVVLLMSETKIALIPLGIFFVIFVSTLGFGIAKATTNKIDSSFDVNYVGDFVGGLSDECINLTRNRSKLNWNGLYSTLSFEVLQNNINSENMNTPLIQCGNVWRIYYVNTPSPGILLGYDYTSSSTPKYTTTIPISNPLGTVKVEVQFNFTNEPYTLSLITKNQDNTTQNTQIIGLGVSGNSISLNSWNEIVEVGTVNTIQNFTICQDGNKNESSLSDISGGYFILVILGAAVIIIVILIFSVSPQFRTILFGNNSGVSGKLSAGGLFNKVLN